MTCTNTNTKKLFLLVSGFIREAVDEIAFKFQNMDDIIEKYVRDPNVIITAECIEEHENNPTIGVIAEDGSFTIEGSSTVEYKLNRNYFLITNIGYKSGIHVWGLKCNKSEFETLGIFTSKEDFMKSAAQGSLAFRHTNTGLRYSILNNHQYPSFYHSYGGITAYAGKELISREKMERVWTVADLISMELDFYTLTWLGL
jgi:hypothetical protein